MLAGLIALFALGYAFTSRSEGSSGGSAPEPSPVDKEIEPPLAPTDTSSQRPTRNSGEVLIVGEEFEAETLAFCPSAAPLVRAATGVFKGQVAAPGVNPADALDAYREALLAICQAAFLVEGRPQRPAPGVEGTPTLTPSQARDRWRPDIEAARNRCPNDLIVLQAINQEFARQLDAGEDPEFALDAARTALAAICP